MRIELCGGIASGKTTLAAALKERFPRCNAVLEDVFSNGFLEDFYRDPPYYTYETEIFILLQHMHQIKVEQRQRTPLVCDFSMEQDYSYGENNLAKDELASFREIYRVTVSRLQAPEFLIFLDCPVDILLRRIAARGRISEKTVNADYLRMTIAQLKGHLKNLDRKIVVIDSHQYDFRKSEDISHLLSGPLRLCGQMLERPLA